MQILLFPKLTKAVRRSMARRLAAGAEPQVVARQYGVSVRWLQGQYPHLQAERPTG